MSYYDDFDDYDYDLLAPVWIDPPDPDFGFEPDYDSPEPDYDYELPFDIEPEYYEPPFDIEPEYYEPPNLYGNEDYDEFRDEHIGKYEDSTEFHPAPESSKLSGCIVWLIILIAVPIVVGIIFHSGVAGLVTLAVIFWISAFFFGGRGGGGGGIDWSQVAGP
ncbi:MAG: hypothetical protein LBS85_05320 [Clostridiales Family XIII bacterium]|nr:hypothetical protein [Clostridiales Family XIII bacterium]